MTAVWAAVLAVAVLAGVGGYIAAEASCRRRWARYSAAGSIRVHGRHHAGRRHGTRRNGAGS